MVKKHDGSWRMCVDFTDLNKACLQDCYPLPKIDWKVESLYGYPFKCFLDAYKGYHQIQMAESDEEKTAFHTSQGVYCYTKMPFGLKNASATYQWLVDKAFDSQVGRNIEVYVDDLVIKSHTKVEMLRDIDETFWYMTSPEGIKSCPDKTEAILQLPSGTSLEATKAALVRATPAGSTQAKGGTDCIPMGVGNVHVRVDSKLVANQVLRAYVAKEENMVKYLKKVKSLVSGFARFSVSQVAQSQNKKADALSKIASTSFAYLSKYVLVEILKEKSIQEEEVTTVVEEDGPT
ncbi:reverse transcriptase domain-containing protein [Tanacetum coccineum]